MACQFGDRLIDATEPVQTGAGSEDPKARQMFGQGMEPLSARLLSLNARSGIHPVMMAWIDRKKILQRALVRLSLQSRLDQLSIRARLGFGFGMIATLTLGTLITSVIVIGGISARADRIVKTRLPATEQSLMLVAHFASSTSALYRFILNHDPNDLKVIDGDWTGILEAQRTIDGAAAEFHTDEQSAWAETKVLIAEVRRQEFALLAEAKGTAPRNLAVMADPALDAAVKQLEENFAKVQTALRGARDSMDVRHGGLGGDQSAELVADVQRIHHWLMALWVGCLALCMVMLVAWALLARSLSYSVVHPIAQITETMRQLARGRLDLQIPASSRRNEIGSMAASVEVFRQNAVELHRSAYYDRLTGLPNRTMFTAGIERMLRDGRIDPRFRLAVLLLDLDNFRAVNDSFSHGHGDGLLMTLASRLQGFENDGALVARLGGDEFAVALPGRDDYRFADLASERLSALIAEPFVMAGRAMSMRASVGAVFDVDMPGTGIEILRNADIAMYQAKAAGGGRMVCFRREMHEKAAQRLRTEVDLRAALKRQEFELFYQPIVRLSDETIAGFEALIRWRHPQRGLVGPDAFIAISERAGIIVDIGRWVLTCAVEQLAELRQVPGAADDLFCSLNVSARQLTEDFSFVEQAEALAAAGLVPPSSIKLELTESLMVESPKLAAEALSRLAAQGFKLAIDDFGTGYSSLSHLHRFPFHTLKIDRSFVMRLDEDKQGNGVVLAINDLADTFGMDVVAEGIERDVELRYLREIGCTYGQGYMFGRPMPFSEAKALLGQPKRDVA